MKRLWIVACTIGSAAAAPASGQVHRLHVCQVNNGGMGDLEGTVTNDVLIDFAGVVAGQHLLMDLTEGTIYQHPDGTTRPPDADLIPLNPNLAFDTFVALGGTDSVSSQPPIFGHGPNNPPILQPDQLFIIFSPPTGLEIVSMSNFLTARVTLSSDARGTWRYISTTIGGSVYTVPNGIVTNGVMIVPEPTTALLVGAAVLGLVLGRRGAYCFRWGTTRQ